MHSAWFRSTFLRVLKCLQIKEGGPNFWGNQFCRKSELFGPPFRIFILKVLWTENHRHSLDFNLIFAESWNFYKLKRGDLISWGNQFWRKCELFGSPFCISTLKVLWTQIHRHSLHFNAFCNIQEYFSQSLEISAN